jgi:hypothetical protein
MKKLEFFAVSDPSLCSGSELWLRMIEEIDIIIPIAVKPVNIPSEELCQ